VPSPTTVLLRTQSDDRLVALARSGHERAFEAIVERYRKPLLRACRRVLPEARAEDAVQQALVAAWSALARGDEVRDLRPWLYRIAHNSALNQLRVSGYDYDELSGLLATGAAPEEELERRLVARNTLTGLAALPDRQREALLATAVQGRGQDEVARAMGISEPAVRQLVHRARTSLRTAATAITPMPLAGWLSELGSRSAPVTDRIGELVGGGGGAAAKLGAVVVLASGAAAGGPAVVDRLEHGGHDRRANAAPLGVTEARAAEPRTPTATTTPAATKPVALVTPAPVVRQRPTATPRSSGSGATAHGERSSGSADGGTTGERDSGSSGPIRHRRHSGDDDRSEDTSHRGTSGDDGESSGSSGTGSGEDDVRDAPEPIETVRPESTPEPGDDGVEPREDHYSGSSSSGSSSGPSEPTDELSSD
jgi:RNA polymerase sigma factor (sigma-70 family)